MMLALSVAARQHSRCLQVAVARCRLASFATTSNSNRLLSPFGNSGSDVMTTSLVVPATTSSSSSFPKSFSTTAALRSDDHVFEWKIHRALSLVQIPMFVVPFVWTNPVTDAVFCTLLVVHSHWGKKK